MPSSFRSPQYNAPEKPAVVNGMGAAHPVNQESDVAPLSSDNNSSVGNMTAWRTKRNGNIPQPISKRTQGSFVKFE